MVSLIGAGCTEMNKGDGANDTMERGVFGEVLSVALETNDTNVEVGESLELWVIGSSTAEAAIDLTTLSQWTVSDPTVVEVSVGPPTVLTALQPGVSQVWASFEAQTSNVLEVEVKGSTIDLSEGVWVDTQEGNSLVEDPSLFDVAVVDDEIVMTTQSPLVNIHSHYVVSGSSEWDSYEFSGKFKRLDSPEGGVGVTFFSDYPHANAYYRLRELNGSDFHISPHGTSVTGGDASSGFVPAPGLWHEFRIRVTDTGERTEIVAKVWADGDPEPFDWQIDCFDSSRSRRTGGTVGCWSMASADNYWAELRVDGTRVPLPESVTLTLESTDQSLKVGERAELTVTLTDLIGSEDVTSEASFEVSEPLVVEVMPGSPAVAVALAPGFSTIQAKYDDVASTAVTFSVFSDEAPAERSLRSTVSTDEIQWTFDRPYPVGRFANGDHWVLGPVRVIEVSPAPIGSGKRLRHGSVINPTVGDEQGYDGRIKNYDSALTVSYPLTLNPNESLVSTVSWLEGDPATPPVDSSGGPRPTLRTAAVLTCLEMAPPEGSLRPPYAGNDKPLFTTAHLQRHLLLDLPPVPSTPATRRLVRDFDRVWLDTKMAWSGRNAHPSLNLPDYGRDLAANINDGILALMLDIGDKEELLVRVVQIGIDFYGLLENGGYWGTSGGGHGPGRKWPILFAGLMLGHEGMKNIGFDYGPERFQEDCQSFYVTAEDHNRFPDLFPVIGAPAWGSRHCNRSHEDDMWRGYRLCCTANNWVGAVLAARMLGAQGLWNHDALFDYQDWHMPAMAERYGVGDSRRSWTDFAEEMWDTYRDDF